MGQTSSKTKRRPNFSEAEPSSVDDDTTNLQFHLTSSEARLLSKTQKRDPNNLSGAEPSSVDKDMTNRQSHLTSSEARLLSKTDSGKLLRFVAPTGLPVAYRDMLQGYMNEFCSPWNSQIALPEVPSDGPNRLPSEVLASRLFLSTPVCLTLRNFRVDMDRIKLSQDLGLSDIELKKQTGDDSDAASLRPLSKKEGLVVDYLCVTQQRIIAIKAIEPGTPPSEFASGLPVRLLFHWLTSLQREVDVEMQLWLIAEGAVNVGQEFRVAGTVRCYTFDSAALPQDLSAALVPSTSAMTDKSYRDLCGVLVAIWCGFVSKKDKTSVGLNVLYSIENFRRLACSYLSEVAPNWNSESHMLPPIFTHRYQEALFTKVPEAGLPSGGKKVSVKNEGRKVIGDFAELHVYNLLQALGRNVVPMLCLHAVEITEFSIEVLNSALSTSDTKRPFMDAKGSRRARSSIEKLEIDFICLHPDFGMIILETKSAAGATAERISDARAQIERARVFLKKLATLLDISWTDEGCTGILASVELKGIEPYENSKVCFESVRDPKFRDTDIAAFFSANSRKQFVAFCEELAPVVALLQRLGSKLELEKSAAVKGESEQQKYHQFVKAGDKVRSNLIQIDDECAEKLRQKGDTVTSDPIIFKEQPLLNIHLMTPEQMDVWNGGSHQLIQGPPGCGKTILLMGAIADAVRRGRHVRVYCMDATRELYRTFAESITGVANLVRCKMFDDLKRDFKMTFAELETRGIELFEIPTLTQPMKDDIDAVQQGRKHPDEISNHELREALMILRKYLEVVKRDESGELEALRDTCVMMDDIDGELIIGKEKWLFAVCCLQEKKFAQLWISGSYGTWYEDRTFALLPALLTNGSCLSTLSTVLRNARGIYDVWSKVMRYTGVSNGEVKMGHRLEGRGPEIIKLETWSDIHLKICDAIERKLSGSSLSCSDFAILFKSRVYFTREMNSTKNELRRRDVPYVSIEEQAKRRGQGEHVLAVDDVENNYSYEWPVVFYVTEGSKDDRIYHDDVLGVSRCTTDLTIIYGPQPDLVIWNVSDRDVFSSPIR